MSSTVPADLPSAFLPQPKLAAVPAQPTAKTRETLPVEAPRTWSFIDRTTSKLQEVTCLQGCTANHAMDMETPQHPHDIWCCTASEDVYLPINESGKIEEFRVLSAFIRQEPFSMHLHERVPHAQVEIVDDHFMESLDPDGLATVILTLEAQLKQFRTVHAQLVELRAQGRVEL